MALADNRKWISLLTGIPEAELQEVIPMTTAGILEARAAFDFSSLNQDLPQLHDIHRVSIRRRGDWELGADILVPKGQGPFPTILYLHGGGWCVGSAEGARWPAARLAAAGYVVVNLDYSLAPERPYPAAVEDVIYAARWLGGNIEKFGGDPGRTIVSGDSAGANLAAAGIVALLGERGEAPTLDEGDLKGVPASVIGTLLFSGVYDFSLTTQEPGAFAGWAEVLWYQAYLGPHYLKRMRDPLVSPVFSSQIAHMPPTYLSCGSYESLIGQTLALARILCWQNTPTTVSIVPRQDHLFHYAEKRGGPAVTQEYERIFQWLVEVTR